MEQTELNLLWLAVSRKQKQISAHRKWDNMICNRYGGELVYMYMYLVLMHLVYSAFVIYIYIYIYNAISISGMLLL